MLPYGKLQGKQDKKTEGFLQGIFRPPRWRLWSPALGLLLGVQAGGPIRVSAVLCASLRSQTLTHL